MSILVDVAVDSRSTLVRYSIDTRSPVDRELTDYRLSVDRVSIDCGPLRRSTVHRLVVDIAVDAPRPNIGHVWVVYRPAVGDMSVNCRSHIGQLSVAYQSTVGRISVVCQYEAKRRALRTMGIVLFSFSSLYRSPIV